MSLKELGIEYWQLGVFWLLQASEVEFSPKQPACPNGWINVHIIRLQA
jgi:hypothetical protein